MNIVMITEADDPRTSGAVRSVLALVSELRRLGHRVLVITPQAGGASFAKDELGTLRVPMLKAAGGEFGVRSPLSPAQAQTVSDFQPHTIHLQHPFVLGPLAVRVATSHGVPLVFTYNSRFDREVATQWPALKRLAGDLAVRYCDLADAVVVPGSSAATFLRGRGIGTPVEIVRAGVEPALPFAGDRRMGCAELNLDPNSFVV